MEKLKIALGLRNQEDPNSFFSILKNEHLMVARNVRQITQSNQPLTDLYNDTANALSTHMQGEEELLYPKLEDSPNRQMAFMSYQEHDLIKQLLNSINSSTTDSDRWIAKVRVLEIVLNNHINFEENQVFPKAKEVMFQQSETLLRNQYQTKKVNANETTPLASPQP